MELERLGILKGVASSTAYNHLQEATQEIESLTAENAELRRRLEEETAIVDRVWKALGKSTYEECKPYSIDEWVSKVIAQHNALAAALRNCEYYGWRYGGNTYAQAEQVEHLLAGIPAPPTEVKNG